MDLVVLSINDVITASDGSAYFYDEAEQEHVYDIGNWFR